MAKPKNPKKMNGSAGVQPADAIVAAAETTATQTTMTTKSARKPSIVKSEPRANLVPINLDDEIRQVAYLLSERRGFEPGHETEDWLTAEREVRQRYHQHSA